MRNFELRPWSNDWDWKHVQFSSRLISNTSLKFYLTWEERCTFPKRLEWAPQKIAMTFFFWNLWFFVLHGNWNSKYVKTSRVSFQIRFWVLSVLGRALFLCWASRISPQKILLTFFFTCTIFFLHRDWNCNYLKISLRLISSTILKFYLSWGELYIFPERLE